MSKDSHSHPSVQFNEEIPKQPVSFQQAIQVARDWNKQAGLCERSTKSASRLIEVLRVTLPQSSPATWAPSDMSIWWQDPNVTKLSVTDRNDLLRILRKILSTLVVMGELELDLAAHLERVPLPRESAAPTPDQIKAIASEIRKRKRKGDERCANMVEFLAYSGCRPQEAHQLQWRDIGASEIAIGGDAARTVPIIEPMRALLSRMERAVDDDPLFLRQSPKVRLKASASRLGWPEIRTRDLRYVFATICLEAGEDVGDVGRWLGCKDGAAVARRASAACHGSRTENQD